MPKLFIFYLIAFSLSPVFTVYAGEYHVDGELLVQFKTNSSVKQKTGLRESYKARLKTRYRRLAIEHWQLDAGQDLTATLNDLNSDPNVVFAEPNYRRFPAQSSRAIPTEGENSYQAQKTPLEQIQLDKMWDQIQGDPNVIVAVVDDAFEISHEDLQANVYLPWNFVDNNDDPSPATCVDTDFNENVPEEHGTTVLGVVGAVTDNGIGVAGAAWNVSVMPLKLGCMFDVAAEIAAFDYAVEKGAHIINASYGGPMFSSSEELAVEALKDSGVLLIAAAGNNEADNDKLLDYPSGLDLPNVIAVAGSDLDGELEDWSQFGQTTVDLAAPASGFRTTAVDNSYKSVNGTSYSAPLVSAVAALLKSAQPTADFIELRGALLGSVTPMQKTRGRLATDGQVNALDALELLNDPKPLTLIKSITIDDGVSGNGRLDYDEEIKLKLVLENVWQTVDDMSASLSSEYMTESVEGQAYFVNFAANSQVEVIFSVGKLDLQANSGYEQIPFELEIEWLKNNQSEIQTRTFYLDYGQLIIGKSVDASLRKAGNDHDDMHFYHIDVPANSQELKIALSLPEDSIFDADLAVRRGGYPLIDYLYYSDPWGVGEETRVSDENGDDTITIRSPVAGTYYIAVMAPLDQNSPDVGYTLKVTTRKTSTGIGGCSLAGGEFDPVLLSLLVISLLYIRKRTKV